MQQGAIMGFKINFQNRGRGNRDNGPDRAGRGPRIDLPRMNLPKVDLSQVQVPRLKGTQIRLPHVALPEVRLPRTGLPHVGLPGTARTEAAGQAAALPHPAMDPDELKRRRYDMTMELIARVSKVPGIRVDREDFLRREFAGAPDLDRILREGPAGIRPAEDLRRRADVLINASTTRSALVSFLTGLPSGPVTMTLAGTADVVQYFAFAVNLAQQVAYLYGQGELFDGPQGGLTDLGRSRIVAYLGIMFGVPQADSLLSRTQWGPDDESRQALVAMTLSRGILIPLLQNVAAGLGRRISRKGSARVLVDAIPALGGLVSGGMTYASFRTMGGRLADAFASRQKD